MDDIKKESLIEALGESGHRESALLLKNWNEMDDNANGILEDLMKAKGHAKGKAYQRQEATMNRIKENEDADRGIAGYDGHDAYEKDRQNTESKLQGAVDKEKQKATSSQKAADIKAKARKKANAVKGKENAPSKSFEHAVSRLKDKFSSK